MSSMLLLFIYTIIVQSMAQNMRSIKLSQMNNIKYECVSVGCLPSTTLFTPNLRRCQMACLAMIQCRTASFYQSTNQCDLFTDIPDEYGRLLVAVNVVTVTTTDSRRLFPRKCKSDINLSLKLTR